MLRLRVAAIGRDRSGPTADLTTTYIDRANDLARQVGFVGVDLVTHDAPKAAQGAARQALEADLLIQAALPGDAAILDERGKNLKSTEFASFLASRRDAGVPGITFFIGGADGHPADMSDRLAPRACRKISLGAATWPHLLVRPMLAEQIYRAMTILAGHPYHRE